MSVLRAETPDVRFDGLEVLWIQVAGTLCNIQCTHCFISCGPKNDSLPIMSMEQEGAALDEAREYGVREIYFTGGEPFLHPRMLDILERTLRDFPATVLTNGMLILERTAARLAELAAASRYSLELRVSLEDTEPARHDVVRGRGTFEKALRGIRRLEAHGLLPMVCVSEVLLDSAVATNVEDREGTIEHGRIRRISVFERFATFLREQGVRRPRIKFLPIIAMGGLAHLEQPPLLTHDMMADFDHGLLQCNSSRAVTANGVYTCPILVGQASAKLSEGPLRDSLHDAPLDHSACTTCWLTGMTCSNY